MVPSGVLGSAAGASPARVLMPTLRRINPHAAWCSIYEFEDVIRAVDDVQLLELERGGWSAPRHRIARSLAWHGRHPALAGMNPGLKPVVVDRDYDLFVFVCMNVWDLLYLNAIHDWQSRCRIKVCYVAEFYSGMANEYAHLLRILARFDHVLTAFSGSIPAISREIGKPCRHVPFAVDVRRFTPFPMPPRRAIDVFSIGGRSVPVHEALVQLAATRDFFYVYDTVPSALVQPSSATQHRDLLANCAKRSRFFVTYEAKFGNSENQGQSEVGARYFEGTAAGAVLLGRAPTVPSFWEAFPWSDPVVEVSVDGCDTAAVLDSLAAKPEEVARLGARNAVHALRRHDWGHRWKSILDIAGVVQRPPLAKRLQALEALADGA
jgi:spore maturation protein CgeB